MSKMCNRPNTSWRDDPKLKKDELQSPEMETSDVVVQGERYI